MPARNHTGPEITYPVLQRFEETLKPPFRRALQVGRVDLLPPPPAEAAEDDPLARAVSRRRAVFDERGERLVIPLWGEGRCLGLVVAWGVGADQLAPQVAPFLSALVETALDLVRLRLAAETDPATGLLNAAALEAELTKALAALTPARVRGRPSLDRERRERGLSLLALQAEGMDALWDRYGRRFGEEVLAELARRLQEAAPEARAAARVGDALLVLVEGGAGPARETATRLRRALWGLRLPAPGGGEWPALVRLGAAAVDAGTWPGRGDGQGVGLAHEAAAVFRARALRALECALRLGLEEVLFYNEILEVAGRVRELLPLDRVRIDLGRVHGLAEGERFQVLDGAEPEGAPKAEIVVTAVEDQSAVAEIAALYDPTCRLQPGDRLRRLGDQAASPSAPAEEVVEVAGRQVRVIADEVTGLACHRSFMDLFRALCAAGGEFAAALVRVEGLEGVREALGRVGSDALLRALAAAAREVFPASALPGRFAPDTLGVLLPATGAEEARELAAEVIARVQDDTRRSLRAGVAAHPCPGFEAAQALDNAAKALVHAGFLEPGAAVVFDAVSLNVSGDALFARGRIAEAVAEYERALGLDPAEPNVLNSLGVCYGHLGQMDKAMDCFQRALAAAPEDFMAYYNLGYALMAQGRLAEARRRFQQCLERRPDHADTLFQLGRLAQGEGRLAEALELFTRAAEQPDCRPAVHRHLGEALAAMGKPAEAEESFKRAVKINPDDAAALSSLAELYLARGANTEIALSLARRARELEPAAARHLRVLSQALLALERLDEAEALLGEATAAHPDDPFLALQQARLAEARGRPAAARDAYRRALALEPNLAEARQGLAALEE